MKAEEMVLARGKTTVNELYLAQKLDEQNAKIEKLTEELARLKPTRFKDFGPYYRPPKTS